MRHGSANVILWSVHRILLPAMPAAFVNWRTLCHRPQELWVEDVSLQDLVLLPGFVPEVSHELVGNQERLVLMSRSQVYLQKRRDVYFFVLEVINFTL